MPPRPISFILNAATFALAFATVCPKASSETLFTDFLKPVFEENCIQCHGKDDKEEGDLNLLKIESLDDLTGDLERLQTIFDVLDFKEMPPEEEPPLSNETYERVLSELKLLLEKSIASQTTFPQTPIRRMNRFQYSNAVQDLFKLKVEVFTLPERMLREHGNYFEPAAGIMPETLKAGSRPLGKSQLIEPRLAGVASFPQDLRAEHGFDNRGDHLSLSPLLMESFLKLSRSIVESNDFNEKNCGIWDSFFTPPKREENLELAIEKRIQAFLTRAFRRPAETSTVDRYVKHALANIEAGESFTDSMKSVAAATIASPRFLYLYDRAMEADTSTDFALASRLSFFLWGSIPDGRLIELAAKGELHNSNTLSKEVDRMLSDERLKRFCDSFPSQWLQLERIISSVPDPNLHPNFYFAKYRASMHMMLEPLLVFETILIENRSILELVDSNFSYRSPLLDSWYLDGGQSNRRHATSIPFDRVVLEDRRQGGVITTAAVMTMTSKPTRTQPITRGAWIASVIFNNPPEPPPADVPPLPEKESGEVDENLTLRERFEAHRDKPECAGCHINIDPLGFAFENYGPTGLWRETYENGREVDSAGTLLRDYPFQNILEFKDAILAEKDRFTRAFAGHLLAFALGRETEIADAPALDLIASETASNAYSMQSIIKQVILSNPFRRKPTDSNLAMASEETEPMPNP
ncbi:MAG: DUF1592 domain-containing protein [Opitutaceae bacterium]|nr:DUF1592 domain-containing protein [Opitutaceae bacterium]